MKKGQKYLTEGFSHHIHRRLMVEELYFEGRTQYQSVHCFRNQLLGKVLLLDRQIQSAEIDESVYHEALVHPAMVTHVDPKRVLILGGGEGATLREVLKHGSIDQAVMVDIDRELIEICNEYLPEWSDGAFEDPRTELIFTDARRFVEESRKDFDVIISDLTEPVEMGPSVYLFTQQFFIHIFDCLSDNGLFVLQAGSTDPHYLGFYADLAATMRSIFPIVRPFAAFMFSFGFPWGFIIASKKEDPLDLDEDRINDILGFRGTNDLKFYHAGLHRGLFPLPVYVNKGLEKGRVLTDEKPFILEA